MSHPDHLLENYNYLLPSELIAQYPSNPPHQAKLLHCQLQAKGKVESQDLIFEELSNFLDDRYLLFLNKSKVFKARIPLREVRIIKKSGEEKLLVQGEIFVYSIVDEQHFECLVSDDKHFRPGTQIQYDEKISFSSIRFTEQGILMQIQGISLINFLEKYGEMPLPPYIHYSKDKEQRYQNFFAQELGSAAAPTASLHFTPQLIKKLQAQQVSIQYLTLHVGLGTFKPVYEPNIQNQLLHAETMLIPNQLWESLMQAKKAEKILLPIGTTMVRFLESLPYIWKYLNSIKKAPQLSEEVIQRWDQLSKKISIKQMEQFIPLQEIKRNGETLEIASRLFIYPGFEFLLTDEIISNFHLPKSSLLMLISAFLGRENLLKIYQEAIEKNYQFYSF